MSDENTEEILEDGADLQEFKSDDGTSEVPVPVVTKAKTIAADKAVKLTSGDTVRKGSKVGMINDMMTKLHGLNKDSLKAQHSKMMEELEDDDDNSVNEDEDKTDTAAIEENRVTAADIDLKDDVSAIFGDEDLSEEFKTKVTTIFEAAVISKINEKLMEVTLRLESENQLETLKTHEELVEKTDSFLDYAITEWREENRLALESGVRTEIAEEFMSGMKKLFEDSYIDIPEGKVDVLANMSEKADELEESLNKEIAKNVELSDDIEKLLRSNVVSEAAFALTDANSEKLVNLSAGVEFVSEEDFREKVTMIKESYFTDGDKVQSFVDESEPLEVSVDTTMPQNMSHYAAAISRSIKK
jgi:hypothetical protein|tara:strand:+ start:408 stop:1481 length:1074 start_codon:yes stop_codon:yes gene_type:complete